MSDHIAIMDRAVGNIENILNGSKCIESRWYVNRVAPWGRIIMGDRIYFKYSGAPVTASAEVSEVLEFEGLDNEMFNEIVTKYADDICLNTREYVEYYQRKRYVILIRLIGVRSIEPFKIDKSGFGISSAWMCVGDINKVKIMV